MDTGYAIHQTTKSEDEYLESTEVIICKTH